MKRILPIFLALAIFLTSNLSSLAQLGDFKGSLNTKVSGTLGEFYLNLSGYQSPFASIILTSDGVFLRATVADEDGNFTISDVLIKRGFSHFCFYSVDFNRIGDSEACLTTAPAQGPVTIKDIFLPPTLGLYRSEIAEGASALAYGYSMPGSKVTLHLSNGLVLSATADSTGYYQFIIKNLKAGKYELYSTSNLNGKDSLAPSKKLELHALSWWEQFIAFLKELWKRLLLFLTSLSLGPLWLLIPIIILIIILIFKLWPGKFTFIYRNRIGDFFIDVFGHKKPLHHKWFVGY